MIPLSISNFPMIKAWSYFFLLYLYIIKSLMQRHRYYLCYVNFEILIDIDRPLWESLIYNARRNGLYRVIHWKKFVILMNTEECLTVYENKWLQQFKSVWRATKWTIGWRCNFRELIWVNTYIFVELKAEEMCSVQ